MIIEKIKSGTRGYSYKCKCDWCGVEFFRNEFQVKRAKGNYCKKSCFTEAEKKLFANKNNPFYGKKHSGKTKKVISEIRSKYVGNKHPSWKGGRIKRDGYIYVYNPEHPSTTKQGYVCEHRLVMEKNIGRFLTKEEIVHHINENRSDNRIENLVLVSGIKEHKKLHKLQLEMA